MMEIIVSSSSVCNTCILSEGLFNNNTSGYERHQDPLEDKK